MQKQRAESFLFTINGSFSWKIHNYLKVVQPKRTLESPVFTLDKHKCRILLYPHGDTQATAGWVSMYLRCEGSIKPAGLESTFKFEFLDEKEQPIPVTTRSMDFNHTFRKADKGWGSSKIIRKDRIQNYLCNGTLHLRVIMNIHNVVTYSLAAPEDVVSRIPDDNTIGEDMEKLLEDSPTDVDFVFGHDGERDVVQAHKMVLSVRSPVFRAMFSGGMKEGTDKEIHIADAPVQIFRSIIRYIYTGKCDAPLLFAHPEEYLYLVDKYDLKGLRQQCEKELAAGLGADNTISLVALSSTFDMPTLREVAWAALSRNFKYIKSTAEFKELTTSNPDLFDEILERVYNNTEAQIPTPSAAALSQSNLQASAPKKVSFVRKHFGKKPVSPATVAIPPPPPAVLPAAIPIQVAP